MPRMTGRRRRHVRRRDKVCQSCGAKGSTRNPLSVHHIKSVKEYPRLVNDVENCVLLCAKCHAKVHGFSPNTFVRRSKR